VATTAPPPDTDQDEEAVDVRPFADVLRELSGGQAHHDLSRRLHELTDAVRSTGRPGKLSLVIEVKPISGTDGKNVTVTDQVTAKIPQAERPKTIFFVTQDGQLSRQDPGQIPAFDLRQVDTGPVSVSQLRQAR